MKVNRLTRASPPTHCQRIGEIRIIHGESEPHDHQVADRVDGAEKQAMPRRAFEILHALCDTDHDGGDLDLVDFEGLRSSGVRGWSARGRLPRSITAAMPAPPSLRPLVGRRRSGSCSTRAISAPDCFIGAANSRGAALLTAHRRPAVKTIAVPPALCNERASPTISRVGIRCLAR
jgi:hypothetical protein